MSDSRYWFTGFTDYIGLTTPPKKGAGLDVIGIPGGGNVNPTPSTGGNATGIIPSKPFPGLGGITLPDTATGTPSTSNPIDAVIMSLTKQQADLNVLRTAFVKLKDDLIDLGKTTLTTPREVLKASQEFKPGTGIQAIVDHVKTALNPDVERLMMRKDEAKSLDDHIQLCNQGIKIADGMDVSIVQIKHAVLQQRNWKQFGRKMVQIAEAAAHIPDLLPANTDEINDGKIYSAIQGEVHAAQDMINVFSAHLKKVKDETESFIAKKAKELPTLTIDSESIEEAPLKQLHSPLRYVKSGQGKWAPIKTNSVPFAASVGIAPVLNPAVMSSLTPAKLTR